MLFRYYACMTIFSGDCLNSKINILVVVTWIELEEVRDTHPHLWRYLRVHHSFVFPSVFSTANNCVTKSKVPLKNFQYDLCLIKCKIITVLLSVELSPNSIQRLCERAGRWWLWANLLCSKNSCLELSSHDNQVDNSKFWGKVIIHICFHYVVEGLRAPHYSSLVSIHTRRLL